MQQLVPSDEQLEEAEQELSKRLMAVSLLADLPSPRAVSEALVQAADVALDACRYCGDNRVPAHHYGDIQEACNALRVAHALPNIQPLRIRTRQLELQTALVKLHDDLAQWRRERGLHPDARLYRHRLENIADALETAKYVASQLRTVPEFSNQPALEELYEQVLCASASVIHLAHDVNLQLKERE